MTSPAEFTLTDAERELLPSPQDVRRYAEHGWYLSQRLFSDHELATLEAASEQFYAGRADRELPVRPARLADWQPADGEVQRHNDYIHHRSQAIGAILRKPLIGAIAAQLAEADEVRIFQSTLILKPPRPQEPSNLVPWHCDRHYWQTCSSERMLTAFIPFHHCDEEMGTITMVDGSHLWKEIDGDDSTPALRPARPRRAGGDPGADRPVQQRRGDQGAGGDPGRPPELPPLPHLPRQRRQRLDRPRRAISLHLQDGANHYRPYTKADGTQVVYNHDVLVHRTAEGHPDYADPTYCPTLWQAAR